MTRIRWPAVSNLSQLFSISLNLVPVNELPFVGRTWIPRQSTMYPSACRLSELHYIGLSPQ